MAEGSIASRLARVANRQTLRLTHHGRKSGKPYDVTIWFLVDGATVYLLTMNMKRQWPRNVQARPDVGLKIVKERFSGTVTVVTEAGEMAKVTSLLKRKYWFVRPFLRFRGPEGAFRVDLRDAAL